MRPCVWARGDAVFDRVVMNVMAMLDVIALVADRVFPRTPLPYATPSIARARCRNRLFATTARQPRFGEGLFDRAGAFGEIGVAGREHPKQVHVIGQEHDRAHVEGQCLSRVFDGRTEHVSCGFGRENPSAAVGDDREEERATGLECATEVRHDERIITSCGRMGEGGVA